MHSNSLKHWESDSGAVKPTVIRATCQTLPFQNGTFPRCDLNTHVAPSSHQNKHWKLTSDILQESKLVHFPKCQTFCWRCIENFIHLISSLLKWWLSHFNHTINKTTVMHTNVLSASVYRRFFSSWIMYTGLCFVWLMAQFVRRFDSSSQLK